MRILSRIKLPAKLENLDRLIEFVSVSANEQGIEQKRIIEIEISTEEALVNIFNYAYQDMDGDVSVVCKSDDNDKFMIEIEDSGIPFNVLSLKEPDTALDISERKIGGLGIFLMRKLMDDIQYRREEDRNVLTIVVSKSRVDKNNPEN
ncbi:MAG: ATP-binding protein [Proteobacteria bacterium]|nr:ATP-binding protein [Pseudomonadota bacterium]